MTTTYIAHHAATPARVWLPSTALPAAATGMLFYLSRVAEGEQARGTCFALALTFLVIASVIGPLICWAYRTAQLEDRVEDELGDAGFRLRRLEADVSALSFAYRALTEQDLKVVGWTPPGPTPPRPPLRLIRDDDPGRG